MYFIRSRVVPVRPTGRTPAISPTQVCPSRSHRPPAVPPLESNTHDRIESAAESYPNHWSTVVLPLLSPVLSGTVNSCTRKDLFRAGLQVIVTGAVLSWLTHSPASHSRPFIACAA